MGFANNTKEGLLRQILGEHRHHQIDTVLTQNEKQRIYNSFSKSELNRPLIEKIRNNGIRRIDKNYYSNNPHAGRYSYRNRL